MFGNSDVKTKHAHQMMDELEEEVKAVAKVMNTMKGSEDPWETFVTAVRGEKMNGRERRY